ncbi:YdeI/OmpD-associated family protein [Paraburkholderia dilworthii]|uniref:YdeI/OmpD-associated family protein n=1 Tax=Paraburkholderia dilworthii TaxID=948106 RepID=A0ABW9DI10_9BURK
MKEPDPMPMPKHNPKVDAYAEKAEDFAKPVFARLRALIHATCPEVIEEVKWGIPHFDYKGDMMCIFAAYKKHCSFTFYKDALMGDARLKANAGIPAAKRFMGKLTSVADLPPDRELKSWIKESMALNEQGLKLPVRESRTPKEVGMPAAFAEKLQANPKIKKIFESKSASFQKEYNVWIGDAKTEATRDKRIEEAIAWIAEGKGRFWRYAK